MVVVVAVSVLAVVGGGAKEETPPASGAPAAGTAAGGAPAPPADTINGPYEEVEFIGVGDRQVADTARQDGKVYAFAGAKRSKGFDRVWEPAFDAAEAQIGFGARQGPQIVWSLVTL